MDDDATKSKIEEIADRFSCEDPEGLKAKTDIRHFVRVTVSTVIELLDPEDKQTVLDRILNTPRSSDRETVSDLVDFITAEVKGLIGWQQDIFTVGGFEMTERTSDNQFRFTILLNGTEVIAVMKCDNFDELQPSGNNGHVEPKDIKGFDVVSLELFDSGVPLRINTSTKMLLKRQVFREFCQMWINRLPQIHDFLGIYLFIKFLH